MKQFQRVNAFILALALFMSMIPAGALPVIALDTQNDQEEQKVVGSNYLYASYSQTVATIDGDMEKTVYQRFTFLPGGKMSVAWHLTSEIYVAAEAEITELKINGKTVTLAAGAKEVKVPLSEVDITDPSKTYDFAIKVGSMETAWNATLILDNGAYHRYTLTGTGGGKVNADNKYEGTMNVADMTGSNNYLTATDSAVTGRLGVTTVVEVDIDITSLTGLYDVGADSSNTRFISMGANIQVIDEFCAAGSNSYPTEAFLFALTKDKASGDLYFQSAYTVEAGKFKASMVPLSETVAGLYHIRAEYTYADDGTGAVSRNSVVSAKYFINGKFVEEQTNVRVCHTGKALINAVRGVKAYTSNKADTNFSVANISVTYDDPAAHTDLSKVMEVMDLINAIGEVVTLGSKEAINTAREKYNLLADAVKPMVSNLSKLENAEAQLKKLENSCIHAMFAATQMTFDGKADESIYTRAVWLSDTLKLSMAWDPNYLYLAFTDADVSNLIINDQTVNISKYSMTKAGVREFQIPLKDILKITNLTKDYDLSFQVGTLTWSGKLVLDTIELKNFQLNPPTKGATQSGDRMHVYFKDLTGTSTSYSLKPGDALKASNTATSVVEFDVDIKSLPDDTSTNAYESQYLGTGLNFQVADDLCTSVTVRGKEYTAQAFKFGFFKRDGKINFGHADNGVNKFVPVDDDGSGKFHVRAEYTYQVDGTVSAVYYVNDIKIATGTNVRVNTGSLGSTAKGMFFAKADKDNMDVTWSNLIISKTNPNLQNDFVTVEEVKNYIDQIGQVTLESEAAIKAARDAVNALSPLLQHLVINLNVLEEAENTLNILKYSHLHAAFSYEELILDGKFFEPSYRKYVNLSNTLRLGAAWYKDSGDKKLYLQLAFEDKTAPKISVSELKVNGKSVKVTSSNSKAGGEGREIRIPLASVGITGYDKTYTISFKVGGKYWSGTLVLDSNNYETITATNEYYGAVGKGQPTLKLKTTNPHPTDGSKTTSMGRYTYEKFAAVSGKISILDMDVAINNMPDNSATASAPSAAFVTDGVTFILLDDLVPPVGTASITEGLCFGLGKQNGELKLYYWYNDTNGNAKLGIANVSKADSYHLRVEYGNGNGKISSVKIFINEVLLAEADSARVKAGSTFSTQAINTLQIYAKASKTTEAGRVDLEISNVSASRPQLLIIDDKSAAANADQVIDAIGEVTMDSTMKIKAARELYDSLTSAQKKLVTKLAVLEAAEAKHRALRDQINAQFTTYAFAEYTTEEMVVDGVLNEKIWRTKQTIFGIGKMGMAWNFNYLYLTVTGSKVDTFKDLKINGKAVTDLGVTGKNIREMRIPLTSLGIHGIDFDNGYEMSFSLGGKTWEGELIFDTGKYAIIKPSSTFWGGAKNLNDGIMKTVDSTSRNRVGIIYDSTNLESVNGMSTILEFDLKINQMPNDGSTKNTNFSRNFVNGGISLCIRDEDARLGDNEMGMEAFMVGLVRQKGNMYLVYWEASTEEYLYAPVDDFGTNNYHLRIEYEYRTNDDVSAKYFVNGLLVAESHNAKQIILEGDGPYGTAGVCRMQIVSYGSAEYPVDAVVSDMSISTSRYMDNPDPRDEITTEAVFGVLDLNHVQKDLVLPKEFVTINGTRYKLAWRTSNTSAVTKEGKVTRAAENVNSAVLTLLVDGEEFWDVTVKVDPMSLEEYESPENVDAAFSKAPIVVDGILDDEGWRMSGRVLDVNKQVYAEYGFQWTQTHLYVAVEYLDGISSLSLKLNDRYFSLKDGKLYRGGTNVGGATQAVTNGNVIEMSIPLSVLGLPSKVNSYDYSMPMSLKAGYYVGNGKTLRLSNVDWVITVNRNHETIGETLKTNDAYHGAQRLANGYRMFDLYGGHNKKQTRSYLYLYRTEEYYENFSDRTYDTRVEFDFYAEALPILPTDGTAYRPQGGIYSVSGPTFTLSDAAEADNYSNTTSFGIINTVHGLLFVLNVGGDIQTQLLHKQVGEKFAIAVEWAKDDTLDLFIDGEPLTTFQAASTRKSGSGDASLGINMYVFFEPESASDNYDVYITNIGFGKVHHEVDVLNQLDFDDFRGKNKLQDKITSDLVLPSSITNGQLDKAYKITWTSNNPALDVTTGKITRPSVGTEVVVLTASLSNGEIKSFELAIPGKKAQNDGVLHVLNDLDPSRGVGKTSKDILFTFDATNNSIIKVLDGKVKINHVILKDGDDRARLIPENLTLWVSDNNETYTRVKDFKLLQVGEKWYLYDFEAECKYVKVHYTQPDDQESTFSGTYGEMIDTGYQKVFGAEDDVTFTQTQYVLTNTTGKTQRDYAWTISKKALGITGNDASIRIYADGKLQYHYVDGSNVVVRINDLLAGDSVTLTVLSSSSKNVMDISNKEGVHEVIYGVKETTITTEKWFYMTLPAGTTFPDGSKLEVETLFSIRAAGCRTSTDGGITWSTPTAVKNNAPEGKTPVGGFSQGGWIFDSVTGRMMFECYHSVEKEIEESHMHTDIIASDDGGKTWYLQYTMPCRHCMDEYKGNQSVPNYALSYSDGIQVSTYDGKGPNVDFVFPVGYSWDFHGNFACYIAYSKDAGDTWHYSSNPVTYPSTYLGTEGGCSEGWIYERSDGVLVLQVRCQDKACIHFKVSYSFDHGISWTNENIYTDFYAVNGQAVAKYMEVNGETTLISAWAGNNSLGGDTYHRNPFVFASSANEGETFRNIQNINFRSFEERYQDIYITETTNIYLAKAGNNLIFNYSRNKPGDKVNTIVEDFDDWFTRTKGGYDNFEHGTVRYEGWQTVLGSNDLATDIARGNYSMKLGLGSRVIRSVPYLQDGKVSMDIYVPAGGNFTVELQSGHTRIYDSISVPVAFRVEGGKIYFNDSTTPAGDGIKEGWNTLVFDMKMTKDQMTLTVNGGKAIDVPLKMDFDDYVNFIAIATDNTTQIYVDEVLIISDLEADIAVTDAEKKAAAEVVELIKAIKTASDRNAAIKKAREAFDKLTQAQQDLIDARVLANNGKSGLDGMINYYDELRLAEDGDLIVKKMISEIGEVHHLSGESLQNIQDAYNKLTWAQKQKVDNYEDLRIAILRCNRLADHKNFRDQEQVEEVQKMIDDLVLTNPLRFEDKVKAARKAYEALAADQLDKIDARKLYDVEFKILSAKEIETARRLASIQQLINSFGNITLESTALIEGLRTVVNALTAEERAVLDDQKLVQAEKTLRTLKAGIDKKALIEYRINGIMSYIESIGQITIEKKALIDSIRASYDKLTAKRKERIENYDTLVAAEAKVLIQLQLTDPIPNTGDTTNTVAMAMPVMLLSALAMAALVIVPKKKRKRR